MQCTNGIALPIAEPSRHCNSFETGAGGPSVSIFPPPSLPGGLGGGGGAAAARLLLVEDDPPTLLMLARLLRMEGYIVSTAASVGEAIRLSESDPFDLLISDVGLPDGSGCDLLDRLQRIRPVRGIAMTGFDNEADLAHCREAGFLEQLVKPIDFCFLEQIIRRVIMAPRMS